MSIMDPKYARLEASGSSSDDLVTRCIYEIATGVWAPGQKLPSVREAERRWGIERRAVMKAYQHLAELGLVKAIDRSGYYVAPDEHLGRVSMHRHELENLYERFAKDIETDTGLSVLGAFRYFAQYAEQKARLLPECAFVECTATQAQGHAHEVTQRLGVPCLAMTTQAIEGKRNRIPSHVKTLLVTGFHYGEMKPLAGNGLEVTSVPIEVSSALAQQLRDCNGDVVIFERDETEAIHIQRDLAQLDNSRQSRIVVTDDLAASLQAMFDDAESKGNLAMLSPRMWGELDERWLEHSGDAGHSGYPGYPGVGLIEFSIVEDAWSRIADTIGLPLGEIG